MKNEDIEYILNINNLTEKLEKNNKNTYSNLKRTNHLYFLLRSFFDLLKLLYSLRFKPSSISSDLIYTMHNLCYVEQNGIYKERLLNNIKLINPIYINYGKEHIINNIDTFKVYNIGYLIKFINLFIKKENSKLTSLHSHSILNNLILKKFNGKNIYLLCHYDINGYSVIFSKHRKKFKIIEVQHGTIVNYPPYSTSTNKKLIDKFYVKNNRTIDFLKNNLNKNFYDVEYEVIKNQYNTTKYNNDFLNIMYISSIELNDYHPLFYELMQHISEYNLNIRILIRLHPRERNKKDLFESIISKYTPNFSFSESINWFDDLNSSNSFVLSPWSSIIEESIDNNINTIIIDKLGKEKFKYLSNSPFFHFTDNIKNLNSILNI
ncbi:MAG: hypothetical protein Q4B43_09825 [Bacteroidota bacterium]|nr:hypothetical protein [Bacteroidota bacterium]